MSALFSRRNCSCVPVTVLARCVRVKRAPIDSSSIDAFRPCLRCADLNGVGTIAVAQSTGAIFVDGASLVPLPNRALALVHALAPDA